MPSTATLTVGLALTLVQNARQQRTIRKLAQENVRLAALNRYLVNMIDNNGVALTEYDKIAITNIARM